MKCPPHSNHPANVLYCHIVVSGHHGRQPAAVRPAGGAGRRRVSASTSLGCGRFPVRRNWGGRGLNMSTEGSETSGHTSTKTAMVPEGALSPT